MRASILCFQFEEIVKWCVTLSHMPKSIFDEKFVEVKAHTHTHNFQQWTCVPIERYDLKIGLTQKKYSIELGSLFGRTVVWSVTTNRIRVEQNKKMWKTRLDNTVYRVSTLSLCKLCNNSIHIWYIYIYMWLTCNIFHRTTIGNWYTNTYIHITHIRWGAIYSCTKRTIELVHTHTDTKQVQYATNMPLQNYKTYKRMTQCKASSVPANSQNNFV